MSCRIALTVLLGLIFADVAPCQCRPAPDTRVTNWGHQNVVKVEAQPLRALSGVVQAGFTEAPGENVLVEIFDHPELVSDLIENRQRHQKRLLACITQKDGKFSFDLPPGKYELRCSKPIEWNCSSVVVTIDRKGGFRRLKVTLQAAD